MDNQELNMQHEPDLETVFEMLKEKMPVPDHVKDGILNAYVYVLSM